MDTKQLLEAFKNSNDFYRHKLEHIDRFEDVPYTTKSELIRSQQNHPPYGNFCNQSLPVYQVYRTSGTTADPLLLGFTRHDIEYIAAVGADCFRHAGMGAFGNEEVVFNCLNLSMWAGGFFDSQAMMLTGVQVINFGTGNTIELVKLIRKYTTRYKVSIHCTPSYLPVIENLLHKEFQVEPQSLKLHALYLGAESGVQNNEFRNSLQLKWNCKVFNANYGMSEVCSIMASANDENILKFSEKLLSSYYMELIDNNGNATPAHKLLEGDTGALVFTSLHKEFQPLLRYHTKEKIRIIKRSGSALYFEILGRSDDMLVFKGINFFPEQLRDIILEYKELTGIYQVQVKQKDGMIEDINVLCEVARDAHIDENNLRSEVAGRIRNELTLKLNVNFVYNFEFKGNKMKIVEYI